MTTKLKIKIKSLAAEATIIRFEERKLLESARYCDGMRWVTGVGHNNEDYVKLIRTQEKPELREHAPSQYARYTQIHAHRTGVVRKEQRYSQLAYAFLRGKHYKSTENRVTRDDIDVGRLTMMIKRFGGFDVDSGNVTAWLETQ